MIFLLLVLRAIKIVNFFVGRWPPTAQIHFSKCCMKKRLFEKRLILATSTVLYILTKYVFDMYF